MQEREELESCAKKLAALTDVGRLRMVDALFVASELTVSALANLTNLNISMASHHLSVLLNSGIVRARKQSRFVYYSLEPAVTRTKDGKTCKALHFGCCMVSFEVLPTPGQSDAPIPPTHS